jgi:hypothetical protein
MRRLSRRSFVRAGALFLPAAYARAGTTIIPGPMARYATAAGGISAAATAALNDWVSRVQGQGSDVTIAGTQTAVGIFIDGLMTDGVWSKIVRMSIYAGDGLNALKAPLKNGGSSATDTLNNFVSGDYSQATGLGGSTGSPTKCVIAGLNWDSPLMSDTSIHMCLYSRTGPDVGITMQHTVNGSAFWGLLICNTGGPTTAFWTNSSVSGLGYSDGIGIGHYIGSRTASNSVDIYRNGVSQAHDTAAGGARVSQGTAIHCMNYQGSLVNPTARKIELYSMGTGLTATDAANYNTRYATLRTALGR